jgi:rubrerythrin
MKKELLGYIKQAIISEIEGYEFYKMAAGQARSPFVKETFLELAEEERKHVEWLQGLFNQMDTGDSRLALESVDAPPSPEFFKWENLDREDPQTTISVFGIAMQMEKQSYEFYGKIADSMDNEEGKQLFKILEAWEKAHYDMFNKEYKDLQADWWSEQGFAPF